MPSNHVRKTNNSSFYDRRPHEGPRMTFLCEIILEGNLSPEERSSAALAALDWCKNEADNDTVAFLDEMDSIGRLLLGEHVGSIRVSVSSTWHNPATLAAILSDTFSAWVRDIRID